MRAAQDSITQAVLKRDSAISDFVSTMNTIQENLDSIKRIQEIVKVRPGRGTEMGMQNKDLIVSDLRSINELLDKNKELIGQLRKQLGSSGLKMEELQRSLVILNRQVESKDAEIIVLGQEVKKLRTNIDSLNVRLRTVKQESTDKQQIIKEKIQTIEKQSAQMNKAFYAFGTRRELINNGVIERSGGVLGLGRSFIIKKDFNKEFFTEVDIRDLKSLPLYVDRASLITNHPAGSYHFNGENNIESLVIDDPQEFWRTSRYLVITIR